MANVESMLNVGTFVLSSETENYRNMLHCIGERLDGLFLLN